MELPVEDIAQLFRHSVVLHKNKPVYVDNVQDDGKLAMTDIMTHRTRIVPFKLNDFAAPALRLGFINYGQAVVYAVRNPVRRYKMGYSQENTKILTIDCYYPIGKAGTRERVGGMRCPEFGDALFNKYPSFAEALKQVTEFKGACAFDKQFCITSERKIFYKTSCVGNLPKGAKTVKEIVWQKGFEHLVVLLENEK